MNVVGILIKFQRGYSTEVPHMGVKSPSQANHPQSLLPNELIQLKLKALNGNIAPRYDKTFFTGLGL